MTLRSTVRQRVLGAVVPAAALLAVAAPLARAQTPAPAVAPTAPSSIIGILTNLRNSVGWVQMSLYDDPRRFVHPHGEVMLCRGRVANRQGSCTFENVRPGRVYAIAVAHDENNNGHTDTNFLGIPTEGYGFSNNARPVLAAPGFDACRFTFSGGVMTVRMVAQY